MSSQLKSISVATNKKRATYTHTTPEQDPRTACYQFLQKVPNGKLSTQMLSKISSCAKKLGLAELGQLVASRQDLRDEILDHLHCCVDRAEGRLGARVYVSFGQRAGCDGWA
jgi:hypothetical protein